MTSIDRCETRLHALRRLSAGELPATDASVLDAHVSGCDRCRARVEAIAAERGAILAEVDVATESAQILARLEQGHGRVGSDTWLTGIMRRRVGLMAFAACVILAVSLPVMSLLHTPPANRVKGTGVSLDMFVNHPEGAERAEDGVRLHEGDQIQFRYDAGGKRYLLIVSLDAQGQILPLYPEVEGESLAVTPTGQHALAGSIILDDSLGVERVFAFFSDVPLLFGEVSGPLRRVFDEDRELRSTEVDVERSDVAVETILIRKESRTE